MGSSLFAHSWPLSRKQLMPTASRVPKEADSSLSLTSRLVLTLANLYVASVKAASGMGSGRSPARAVLSRQQGQQSLPLHRSRRWARQSLRSRPTAAGQSFWNASSVAEVLGPAISIATVTNADAGAGRGWFTRAREHGRELAQKHVYLFWRARKVTPQQRFDATKTPDQKLMLSSEGKRDESVYLF